MLWYQERRIGFITGLHVELKEGSDNIWVVTKRLVYASKFSGYITVPEGFETDFASVPRVPFVYRAWGDRAHREAVLHDYIYRKDSVPALSRALCDDLFLESMESRGVAWKIRKPMYYGVRLFGGSFYHKRNVEDKF